MEQKQPSKEELDAFLKEYAVLIEKHAMDFVHYPMYIPDGTGGFKTVVQSTAVSTTQLTKSPKEFVEKD